MRPGTLPLVALLAIGAALALAAAAEAIGGPQADFGGEPRQQLVLTVETSGDVLESGGAIAVRVAVVDQYGYPVAGATVAVAAEGGTVTPDVGVTDANGFARFTFTARASEVVHHGLRFAASHGEAIPDDAALSVTVLPPSTVRPSVARAESISVGLGALAIAAVASTEFGRYGLFNLAVFPLYSRLKKEQVLDHFVRGQIYGHIQSHPGAHYNGLKEALRVTNGTLAHHLRTLEVQGFIRAHRDGVYKRFYPVEMRIPRDAGIRLSDLQHRILDVLGGDEGPTQGDIAERLDVSQQTASYNLRHLSREGLVRIERDGRLRRYFPDSG